MFYQTLYQLSPLTRYRACMSEDARYFKDLPLSQEVLKGLRKLTFRELTPIQVKAMPLLLKGMDVIGQAQTGTGKTAAFGVPLVMRADPSEEQIQGLVIAPTRELAQQVALMIRRFARYTGVKVQVVYGGENINKQITRLGERPHVLVGTPGRLIDLIKRRVIDLRHVKVTVVDEADKMLEMGFIEDVGFILSKTPFVRQTSMWSATLSPEIIGYARRYMISPQELLLSRDDVAQPLVDQYYVKVEPDDKLPKLMELIRSRDIDQAVIFCNTRESADELAQKLIEAGVPVEAIHGKYSQSKRKQVLDAFKLRTLKYIVATDVAGRGLDIQGVSHIFNYEVPQDPEVYFHRVGRTGRMEERGTSVTLVTEADEPYFTNIIGLTKVEIKEM
ncbi:DEAD/DEAH box helicase [Candidatus Bathyarchaeota archaeon]|nr:DEAD/DEAH box helicase [Candidatus Bathyarchaeota archaeon]